MSIKPKIIDSKIVAQTRFFTIEEIYLHFANGAERHFERVSGRYLGSVTIVPFLDDETLLLVREYAVGIDNYVLGFPKGAVEKDERLLETANRELMEEAGYGSKNIKIIGKFSSAPGYVSSTMTIVVAKNLYQQRLIGDEPEPLEIIPWSIKKIDHLLEHIEFYEVRSITALLLVERLLNNGKL